MKIAKAVLCVAVFLSGTSIPQAHEDHGVVLKLGGIGEWGINNGGSKFGPAIGIEITPIEDVLAVEVEAATMFGNGETELA